MKKQNALNSKIIKSWIASLFTRNNAPLSPRPLGEGVRRTGEGFTLAEVLITLGIIGVVAAITLPALITNIQDRVKEKRVQNIQQKFSKAMDKMLATSGLNGYESTLDFVNELKNHLSIAKICENDELRNCWPTEKVIIDDEGTEWEISKTTTRRALKMKNDTTHQWDDTVGIITGDGTAMILSYNTKCDIDPTKTTTWTSDKSSSTSCIAAVFDWNGSSKPNAFGIARADVLALNATGLGSSCVMEINGSCFKALIPTTGFLTYNECLAEKDELGIQYCHSLNSRDCYAWAVKQCGHVSKMANEKDLAAIATRIYGTGIPSTSSMRTELTYNSTIATSLGFPTDASSGFWLWDTKESGGASAYYRHFEDTFTYYDILPRSREASSALVLCKDD